MINFFCRAIIVFYFGIANSGTLSAQDQPVDSSSEKEKAAENATSGEEHKIRAFYREKWENAFDFRSIEIMKKPHYMIGAQWVRKFTFGTMVGIGAIGTPTNLTIRKNNGQTKDTYSFYGAGAFFGQQVLNYRPFRVILFANAGGGLLYHRGEVNGVSEKMDTVKFRSVDPGVYATFYSRDSIDIGVSFSAFVVDFDRDNSVEESDLSGGSVGLTFRKLYH